VAITLTAANYVLVPTRGVAGAILAILIAMVVQLIGYFFVLILGLRKRSQEASRYA